MDAYAAKAQDLFASLRADASKIAMAEERQAFPAQQCAAMDAQLSAANKELNNARAERAELEQRLGEAIGINKQYASTVSSLRQQLADQAVVAVFNLVGAEAATAQAQAVAKQRLAELAQKELEIQNLKRLRLDKEEEVECLKALLTTQEQVSSEQLLESEGHHRKVREELERFNAQLQDERARFADDLHAERRRAEQQLQQAAETVNCTIGPSVGAAVGADVTDTVGAVAEAGVKDAVDAEVGVAVGADVELGTIAAPTNSSNDSRRTEPTGEDSLELGPEPVDDSLEADPGYREATATVKARTPASGNESGGASEGPEREGLMRQHTRFSWDPVSNLGLPIVEVEGSKQHVRMTKELLQAYPEGFILRAVRKDRTSTLNMEERKDELERAMAEITSKSDAAFNELRKEDEIQKHLKFIHKIVKLKLKYKKNQDSKI